MSGYIMSIVGMSLLVGVADILTPENSSFRKYMRLLSGLCVLAVVISPLGSAISFLSDSLWDGIGQSVTDSEEAREKYEEILGDALCDASRKNIEDGVLSLLRENFGICDGDAEVSVTLETKSTEISVGRVYILLRGKARFKNTYEIEEYFASLFSCECVTAIG